MSDSIIEGGGWRQVKSKKRWKTLTVTKVSVWMLVIGIPCCIYLMTLQRTATFGAIEWIAMFYLFLNIVVGITAVVMCICEKPSYRERIQRRQNIDRNLY